MTAEIVLRLYHPIHTRITEGRITLPANIAYSFSNLKLNGVNEQCVHTKNNIGFRGEDWNEQTKEKKKIFFVGGSTTECFYLSDGKDWPTLVGNKLKKQKGNYWVNNAGLDGHSTYGHQLLLQFSLQKRNPDYIVFLIGRNDLAAMSLSTLEYEHISRQRKWYQGFETYRLIKSFQEQNKARKRGVGHFSIDFKKVEKTDTQGFRKAAISKEILQAYVKRIQQLGDSCVAHHIDPIFCTQPALIGDTTDVESGLYLGNFLIDGESSASYWLKIAQLNKELIRVCKNRGWKCLDLAAQLPKKTAYYYDYFHFNEKGSSAVAEFIGNELISILP